MRLLLKLDYAKFCVSNFLVFKGYRRKTLGGRLGKGMVLKKNALFTRKTLKLDDKFTIPKVKEDDKLKVTKKPFVWSPLQLFNDIVLFPNNCQNVYENR